MVREFLIAISLSESLARASRFRQCFFLALRDPVKLVREGFLDSLG
jgi:hypothetical protein